MNKQKAKRVLSAICSVLWEVWDPIGVNDNPDAFGEYDSYTGGVYGLLTRGASDDEIVHYLRHTATVNMGCPAPRMERLSAVVSALRAVDLEPTEAV